MYQLLKEVYVLNTPTFKERTIDVILHVINAV